MSRQEQFLNVIDRDLAEQRFHQALRLAPLGEEIVPLSAALGRVLGRDVVSRVDVPSFDRSNYDGFAVRAADTFGAAEETPRRLRLLSQTIASAVVPKVEVAPGTAAAIATGGMVPRGADAVVMVEHADEDEQNNELLVRRAVTPGFGITFAGTDIAAGETVLRRGTLFTSRETGVLAAIGASDVTVWRRPRVAILSTGDELIAPGQPMRPPLVYDSNARILADAVRELGGEPVELGIVADDLDRLRQQLNEALASCDVVLLSGGTSKGAGDLSYRVVSQLRDPGIVVHGVALKPGKPVCLAASGGKPVVVLPGFPTSAIFTFHEFVAPVIRRLAGAPPESRSTVPARLAVKVNSDPGRTEYLLVGLVEETRGESNREWGLTHFAESAKQNVPVPLPVPEQEKPRLVAYPMGKGSGSVTTFSQADGFITIGRHEEIVEAGATVAVQLLGRDLRPADLVVIGSHCVGLDYLLGRMQESGYSTRFLAVGSTAGLEAVRRGQCDLAGVHLLDAASGIYNRPFLTADMELVRGYGRKQGVVFRRGDARFEGKTAAEAVDAAKRDPECIMVNRNQGSGTRILIDQLLGDSRPAGYAVQSRSHNAVAAAVAQGRADWGVAIENVARRAGLGFLFVGREEYDFAVARDRMNRPAVQAFARLLADKQMRSALAEMGFAPQQ